ncbi:MAG: hypothetical protein RLZ72_1189, partial [Actinomycetota bacterium]
NTPFTGIELNGRVVSTIFRGTETVIDGSVVDANEVRKA